MVNVGGALVNVALSGINVAVAVGRFWGVAAGTQEVRKLNVRDKMETGFIKKRVIWNPPACWRFVRRFQSVSHYTGHHGSSLQSISS